VGDELFLRISIQAQDAASAAIDAIGGNLDALTAGLAATGDAMATVGASADAMATSLVGVDDTLVSVGASADAAVAGIGGVDASIASVALSSDAAVAGIGGVDASLTSVAASASAAVVGIGGVTVAEADYVVGMGGVVASTNAATVSLGAFDASLLSAKATTEMLSGALDIAKVAFIAIGVAAVGVGVVTTKLSGDFQQLMTKLTTTAGESTDKIKMVGQGILDMSVQVGTGALKLGDAMYWIESGGVHGAKALTDLKIAAMGAKAENANLNDVSKVLMFTLNNFSDTGLTAASAMNTLIAGVGNGEMTLQGLSGAISNVMPTAKTFGISLTDIVAGLDTMTSQGDDAAAAATHLAMMIKTIEAPSKAGADALHSIGLTTQQVTDEMRKSMPDAIQMITDAMKKKFPEGSTAYNEALKAISGGSRSMAAIMETSGTQLDTFRTNVDNISKAVKAGGNSIAGWSDVQQNFNFKMDAAKASMEKVEIEIGTKLLPVAGRLMDFLASPAFASFATAVGTTLVAALLSLINTITTLVSWGTSTVAFFQKNQWAMDLLKASLIATAIVVSVLVIPALIGLALAMIPVIAEAAVLAAPFVIAGLIIAAMIFGVLVLMHNWGAVSQWFAGVWSVTWRAVSNAFQDSMDFIETIGYEVISAVVGFFQSLPGRAIGAVQPLGGLLQGFWSWLESSATNAGSAIIQGLASGIRSAIGAVTGAITDVTGWISAHLPHSPAKIGPLRDLAKQGSLIPEQISEGIKAGQPVLDATINAEMLHSLQSPALNANVGNVFVGKDTSSASSSSVIVFSPTINVTVSGRSRSEAQDIADKVKDELTKELNRSGVMVPWQSGGKT